MSVVSGIGDLYTGDTWVRRVGYSLTIQQEQIEVRAGGAVTLLDGLREIIGRFWDVDNSGDFDKLYESGETLTLRLQDGRRWDCFVVNPEGSAVSTGRGLYQA